MRVASRADLAVALLSRFRAEEPRPNIHVSDLANPCLRRTYYAKKGLAPAEDTDILLWLAGKAHHNLMEGRLREIKLEKDGIVGTIDCIDGERIVNEFKTTRTGSSKNVINEYPFWCEQIMGYCHLYGDAKARLFVLHLLGDWGRTKFLPELKAYELEFTQKELEDNWQELLHRRDILENSLRDGDPPLGPRQGMEWVCERCSARKVCNEDLTKQLW